MSTRETTVRERRAIRAILNTHLGGVMMRACNVVFKQVPGGMIVVDSKGQYKFIKDSGERPPRRTRRYEPTRPKITRR